MKIVVAPSLSVIRGTDETPVWNLGLDQLPPYVEIMIVGDWETLLLDSPVISERYELWSLLLRRDVKELTPSTKATHLRVTPDILTGTGYEGAFETRQQLFGFLLDSHDSHRIYAGAHSPIKKIEIGIDRIAVPVININPFESSLVTYIEELRPRLVQLKHDHTERKSGPRIISSFSAFDKNDTSYAEKLLQKAFEDHPGDIDDRTYLYTYDPKNKTFVEFRPSRNNTYHGMDIDIKRAKEKAADIVKKYHK